MIAKVGSGTSFGGLQSYLFKESQAAPEVELESGLQDYLLGDQERVLWSETRNLWPEDSHLAAVLMDATASQNYRVEKPVYHLSLSASPGEELDRKGWRDVTDRVLRRLGLEEHQALVVGHGDTHHPHVHVMVNRVHPETLKAWDRWQDYPRIERELRHIERDMKLREVPGHHYQLAGQERPGREPAPTSGEKHETRRTGRSSWGDQVRFRAYDDMKRADSWADLERRLARHGLRLRRRGGGLVLTDGTRQVKASRVYRRGSYASLKKRFGRSFEEWRRGKGHLIEAIAAHQDRERRHSYLNTRGGRAKAAYRKAQEAIERREEVRAASRRAASSVSRALSEVYRAEDLPKVRRRLVADVRRIGWKRTAQNVAETPRRYGRLRSLGVGLPKTVLAKRRRRTNFLHRLPTILGKMAVLRATRSVAGPAGYRAISASRLATQSWKVVKRQREGLPSYEASLGAVASRAASLGVNTVGLVLAPEPMKLVRVALRAAQLARSMGRGR